MIVFDLSLEIARPRDEVFAWWADPRNLTKWQTGIDRVDFDGEAAKGARFTVVRKALGMTQEMRTTFVEFVPGERVVEKARGGPATNTVTTTFEDAGLGRTRMSSHVEIDLGGRPWASRGQARGGEAREAGARQSEAPEGAPRVVRGGSVRRLFAHAALRDPVLPPATSRVHRAARARRAFREA